MSKTELTLMLVSAVVVAIIFGWMLRWIYDRVTHAAHNAPGKSTAQDAQLKEAIAAQHRAEAAEAALNSELRQQQAETEALRDGLRGARQRQMDLEAELEDIRNPS